MTLPAQPILRVQNVSKTYHAARRGGGKAHPAVDDVSLAIDEGERIALVGASGSGKTTLARIIAGLEGADRGTVEFAGRPLRVTGSNPRRARAFRPVRSQIQMVFQNPSEALNPRQSVSRAVGEPLQLQHVGGRSIRHQRISDAIDAVGLGPPERHWNTMSLNLSGGQRQRLAIARAVVLKPRLLLADEPVSMLDASIRADVLNLLIDLSTEMSLTLLFITHDLASARYVSDRVVVMHQGRIVEQGETEHVITSPSQSYTRELLGASTLEGT